MCLTRQGRVRRDAVLQCGLAVLGALLSWIAWLQVLDILGPFK